MNTKASKSIKSLTIAGLLTALAIVIPLFMPKLPVPQPFSVTPASHLAVILSMFVSPFTVVCTVIGSTIAFFAVLGPVVAMRAFSHLLFALVGCYMLKKRYNLILTIIATAILHALGEVLVVYVFSLFGMADATMYFMWGVTGGITLLHHCFDFVISMIVYKALVMVPGLVELAPVKGMRNTPNKKIIHLQIDDIPNIENLSSSILKCIKPKLKAPITAIMCDNEELTVIDNENDTYTVMGHVSSQNSYGAMLSTDFTAKVKYTNEIWITENVVVGKKNAEQYASNFLINYIIISIFVVIMAAISYFLLTSFVG